MVESKGITSKYSLVSFIRDIDKEALYDYGLAYLKKHIYVSSKNLTGSYLYDYYSLTHTSIDYHKIKSILSHRFGNVISRFLQEKRIFGYSSSLYKRVDIVKRESIDIIRNVVSGRCRNLEQQYINYLSKL